MYNFRGKKGKKSKQVKKGKRGKKGKLYFSSFDILAIKLYTHHPNLIEFKDISTHYHIKGLSK
jgi:hypothetical protein